MATSTTIIRKGARITGAERAKFQTRVVKLYKKGSSIREIADTEGRSYGNVHRVLTDSGIELRGRGATRTKATGKATARR